MPAKASEKPKSSAKDEFNLHQRTEQVYDWLLRDWETNPDMKNRSDALKIMQVGGMFLTRNLKLQDAVDESHAGSTVRKYSGAFRTKTADGGDRRSASGRSVPALIHSVATDNDDTDDPEAA